MEQGYDNYIDQNGTQPPVNSVSDTLDKMLADYVSGLSYPSPSSIVSTTVDPAESQEFIDSANTTVYNETELEKLIFDVVRAADKEVRFKTIGGWLTDDLLEKSPFALSGGQKRRVAIAGVIAMEPEVLVLDEPSAGLDPQGREELLSNIREFHRARGTTVVLVSHSMEEIAKNVDRIVVLSDSHVLMSGTPREVFARGDELMTAGLDVPQVTRVAMALRDKGIAINPAVYTVDELSKELVALKRGGGKKC
jgi:ABC-type glutathione transport system ATPase component